MRRFLPVIASLAVLTVAGCGEPVSSSDGQNGSRGGVNGGGTGPDGIARPPKKQDDVTAKSTLSDYQAKLSLDAAGRVVGVDLSNTLATNSWLIHLRGLPNVERLDLRDTKINDGGLVHLKPLKRLISLWPPDETTDAGLNHLLDVPVEELFLQHTQITPQAADTLAKVGSLRVLDLEGIPISDAGLAKIGKLTRLEELGLSSTGVTDAGLPALQNLPNLRRLNLSLNEGITDAGLQTLRGFGSLRNLDLVFTSATQSGVDGLREARPNVNILF